jgi:hypothetical protein
MRARWAQTPLPLMESGTLCQLLQQFFNVWAKKSKVKRKSRKIDKTEVASMFRAYELHGHFTNLLCKLHREVTP